MEYVVIGLFSTSSSPWARTTAWGSWYHKEVDGGIHFSHVLDNSIFSDFNWSRGVHQAATFNVPRGDPLKFSMATLKLGTRCFERVWQTIRPERTIQDFDKWPGSMQAIVDNDGRVVEPEKASGQRQQRAYLGGPSTPTQLWWRPSRCLILSI